MILIKQDEMVDCQIRTADVTNYSILKAFSRVAREKFVPDGASSIAYCETNIHLGEDRYLLEPRIFAKMLELLKVNSNDLIFRYRMWFWILICDHF